MSLNKVILIGNVGKEPDVHYFDDGNAVAKFQMATSERGYKLANGTEIPERTEWHSIVATRDRAQFVEKHIKKGSLLYVEGKIRTRSYNDKDGNVRYITEIYADRIDFYSIGSGNRREEDQQETGNANGTPVNMNHTAEIPPASEPADDLPF
ncbi:MAG: single-stranded DNA-binding protein [Tannerella sp.]|jgi:single-strand DNA-binding protein|nr:single-stranded DNA-binding protein [Tannerella sp.]